MEEEIDLKVKPIWFTEIKGELDIKIKASSKTGDIINAINTLFKIDIPVNCTFVFKGKKLNPTQTLQEQNISKSGLRWLMQKGKEDASNPTIDSQCTPSSCHISSSYTQKEIEINKVSVYINQKYSNDENLRGISLSLLKTLPGIENLSSEEIKTKIDNFISTLKPEELSEYSLTFSSEQCTLSEENLTSIYAWGNGINGQLGLGLYIKTEQPIPVNLLRHIKIKKIACGLTHSIALTENYLVYAWGKFFKPITNNPNISTTGDYSSPILMESITNETIIKIACGSNHSMALNIKGELFTWGEGIYGQLGHGLLNNEIYPRKVELPPEIKISKMKGGSTHTMCVTKSGYLLGWGSNENNQLWLQKIKHRLSPIIIPIYEFNNNMTIDDYRFITNRMKNQTNLTDINENLFLNELSTKTDDWMKVQLLSCGMWYTACTSQWFPMCIFIIGNNFNRTFKLTYFQDKKIEIKQIKATTNVWYIWTSNNVYKIRINDLLDDWTLSNENEAELVRFVPTQANNLISKIACGYDYIMTLSKYNDCFYYSTKTGKCVLINTEIKSEVVSISSGMNHCFVLTKLNTYNYATILFNMKTYCDMEIISSKGNSAVNSVKCHSFIFDLFIDCSKLNKESNNNNSLCGSRVHVDWTVNEINLLLEIIYTFGLKIKKIAYDHNVCSRINEEINNITSFIGGHGKDGNEKRWILELIAMWKHKTIELQDREIETISSKDNDVMNALFTEMLNKTYKWIWWTENKQEWGDADTNDINTEQKEGSSRLTGCATELKFEKSNSVHDINIEVYKNYQEQLENTYTFNKKLLDLKGQLITILRTHLITALTPNIIFNIKTKETTLSLNKYWVMLKSLYFKNYISLTDKNEISIEEFNFSFSNEEIVSFVTFLKNGAAKFTCSKWLDTLELAHYFMVDKLSSWIETFWQEQINYCNVVALIEIAKDYKLLFLYRTCIMFIVSNNSEVKNKGLMKYIKSGDKEAIMEFMHWNKA